MCHSANTRGNFLQFQQYCLYFNGVLLSDPGGDDVRALYLSSGCWYGESGEMEEPGSHKEASQGTGEPRGRDPQQ